MTAQADILTLSGVQKHYGRPGRNQVRAVDGVSLSVAPGETVGVAGESGCGKSTLARLALRLIDPTAGEVRIDGEDATRFKARHMLGVRRKVQAVFQDPLASMNPLMSIEKIMSEPFETHRIVVDKGRIETLLGDVGLSHIDVKKRPGEFSGGQLQRIAIARALSLEPELIVADEPTSALDPAIQAQIINVLLDIQRRRSIAYLVISHDLEVLSHICDRLAVMYLGVLVETGPGRAVRQEPLHPYTQALMSAAPTLKARRDQHWKRILLPGDPPNPAAVPAGCRFHPRCPLAQPVCREKTPSFREIPGTGRFVACHFAPDETADFWRRHSAGEAPAESADGQTEAAQTHASEVDTQ